MFGEYIHLGIAHIGATVSEWYGPQGFHLPDGIDHILFLVALALGSGTLWQTLKTATGFTLGHSFTLALAALGVVHPPSRWIEPAIALSIAYLAAESLFHLNTRQRWKIAAAFGLIHGFGFASTLPELSANRVQMLKELLGFNLGVEIGQIIILLALVPIIASMRQEPLLHKYGLRSCSVAVLGIGLYWFVVRAWG